MSPHISDHDNEGYSNYSPVTVSNREVIGIVFLGIMSFILLVQVLRLQAENKKLAVELARQNR